MLGKLFGISEEARSEIQKIKNKLSNSDAIDDDLFYKLCNILDKVPNHKFYEKYFGDIRYGWIAYFLHEYGMTSELELVPNIPPNIYEEILSATDIVGSEYIRDRIRVSLEYLNKTIQKDELLLAHNRIDYDVALRNSVKEKHLEITKDYKIATARIKYGDTEQQYDLEKHILNYNYEYELASHLPELKEQIDESFARQLVDLDYKFDKIDKYEYEKEIATFNKKSWHRFSVLVNPKDPSDWEFDIDYNKYFVEWLKDSGYDLPDNVIAETPEDELDSSVIELWFKSTFTSIAAGFLRSESGDSFRSVVASDPASIIIEELQIDKDRLEEVEDEGFKTFVKDLKSRRSYR